MGGDVKNLPTRLLSEPIVSVICEVRFEAAQNLAVNLMPGLLFEKFGDFDSIDKLPVAELPESMLGQEQLKYQPHLRLNKGNRIIAVGSNMLSAACLPPYGGWQNFRTYVLEVLSVLRDRAFVSHFSRLSLRYTDIISIDGASDLNLLDAEIRLGKNHGYKAILAKLERDEDGVTIITQVAGPAQSSDGRAGLIIDVDTISESPTDFWNGHEAVFNKLHSVNKEMFFEMLRPETVKALRPEY